jgi:hypothetical protein
MYLPSPTCMPHASPVSNFLCFIIIFGEGYTFIAARCAIFLGHRFRTPYANFSVLILFKVRKSATVIL